MKILHVTYSLEGGAGIAAGRLANAQQAAGLDVDMLYFKPYDRRHAHISRFARKLNGLQNRLLGMFLKERSINLFPTRTLHALNAADADIVHLHWINAEMLSVAQVGKLAKPLVWTFHDMWPFRGAEHYASIPCGEDAFLPLRYPGAAVDRWVFRRKLKHWSDLHVHIVCPSRWLADCVRNGALLDTQPVNVIPNCLDLSVFRPLPDRETLRRKYGLPRHKPVILFGAYDMSLPRKGGCELRQILQTLPPEPDCALAAFGTGIPPCEAPAPVIKMGMVTQESEMAERYNLADVFISPALQDNLPNMLVEAASCGVPCVAFDVGGTRDILTHQETGYLARPGDIEDFRNGIAWVLRQQKTAAGRESMRDAIRRAAEGRFSPRLVVNAYEDVYRRTLCAEG